MAQRERVSRDKGEDLVEEGRHKKKAHQPLYDQFKTPDEGIDFQIESAERHAASLASASSDVQRANLVIQLQQSYGNAYVQRLLDSRAVQAKLTVNPPGDEYEMEADRVADTVLKASQIQRQEEEEEELIQAKPTSEIQRQEEEEEEEPVQTKPTSEIQRQEEEEELQMKASKVQRQEEEEEPVQAKLTSQIQRQEEEEEEPVQAKPTSEIQRQEGEEEEEPVQAKAPGSQPLAVPEDLEAQINTARGTGQPLDDSVRASLEPHFRSDFSQVRIHTDAEADRLSGQLGARAFTTEGDIFFRNGEYDPETPSGQKLLAHELTHTQQQGTSKRIAPWWPLGHRVITNKVFADTDYLGIAYQDDAKKYLEARSPDMDFVQDETNAMEKGRNASESVIKDYMKLMKKKNITEDEKATAVKMWDENQLHKRPEWYMMHHGEGGLYQEEASAAAARNRAMTESLVKMAADLYNAGKRESGLSVLSDALHQAEDRGSHQEGEMFKGHDIRRTIPPKYVPEEAGWQPQPGYQSNKDCDNAGENPGGATQALLYADETLRSFLGKIAGFAAEVTLKNPEAEQPSPRQRHTKMTGKKLGITVTPTITSTDWRTPLKGQTKSKKIKGIKAEEWQQAEQPQGGFISAEEPARRKGLVEQAEHNYKIELIASEIMERIRAEAYPAWKYDDKVLSHAELTEIGLKHFNTTVNEIYPQLIDNFTPMQMTKLIERAVQQYKYQWSELYEGAKPAEVLKKEDTG